jgi:hypothetical protein
MRITLFIVAAALAGGHAASAFKLANPFYFLP